MRKSVLSVICIAFAPILCFTSCDNEENDDKIPPVVEYAKININDTIIIGLEETRIINDSTKLNHQIDTMVIGKWMYVSARFTDNEEKGLSTFKVEANLLYKGKEDVKDSILQVVKLGRSIFGQNDVTVHRNRLVQINDTITRNLTGIGIQKLGLVEDDYQVKVVCIDVAGNRDSLVFPVRFLRRGKILDEE